MRIRRRPSILLASTPIQTPDLLAETHELKNSYPWRSDDQQDFNTKASESRLLHSVEDLEEEEANKAFPFFKPDQPDQSSLSSFLVSKGDLKESHPQNPSVNPSKSSSGAPPSPANRRRRPALLMEGSRCSRVNGRGWRCSQPTLVGYSLCEHHLGKGRLRSMSSVNQEKLGSCSPEMETTKKAKKKIGVVKARSLSSLLGDDIAGAMALPPPELRRSGER